MSREPRVRQLVTERVPGLILVDGLAGAGKSTTAQRLWIHLRRLGLNAEWFHEHESGHPIYHFVEMDELIRLDGEEFWKRITGNWQALTRRGTGTPIRVLEGSLFQIPVGLLLSKDVPRKKLKRMILTIVEDLRAVNPPTIYLRVRDVEYWLARNASNRGQMWVGRMTELLAQTPYGWQHGRRDVSMLTDFYSEQQGIIDEIVAKLPMRLCVIDVNDLKWELAYAEMAAFLGIGDLEPLRMESEELAPLLGTFRANSSGAECTISAGSGVPRIDFGAVGGPFDLLPVIPASGEFCLRSLPATLRFDSQVGGTAAHFVCDIRGPKPRLPDVSWHRVVK